MHLKKCKAEQHQENEIVEAEQISDNAQELSANVDQLLGFTSNQSDDHVDSDEIEAKLK